MASTMAFLAAAVLLDACGEGEEEPVIDSLDSALISTNNYSWAELSANMTSFKALLAEKLTQSPTTGILSKPTLTYIARCALPASSSVTIRNTVTGITTTYPGRLGVFPAWPQRPPTEMEAECIVGCIEGHMNAKNRTVPISDRGQSCGLTLGPADAAYGWEEGAYFGGSKMSPMYFCVGKHERLECGPDAEKAQRESRCPAADLHCNLTYAGDCSAICSGYVNGGYEKCQAGGRTYYGVNTINLKSNEFGCD
jgi:hypothetical protein